MLKLFSFTNIPFLFILSKFPIPLPLVIPTPWLFDKPNVSTPPPPCLLWPPKNSFIGMGVNFKPFKRILIWHLDRIVFGKLKSLDCVNLFSSLSWFLLLVLVAFFLIFFLIFFFEIFFFFKKKVLVLVPSSISISVSWKGSDSVSFVEHWSCCFFNWSFDASFLIQFSFCCSFQKFLFSCMLIVFFKWEIWWFLICFFNHSVFNEPFYFLFEVIFGSSFCWFAFLFPKF